MVLVMGLTGCDFLKKYPKQIQEFPGPWQAIEPGKPLEKFPRVEILQQGKGDTVGAGDLVQIHVEYLEPHENTRIDFGDWWAWAGFRTRNETVFFDYMSDIGSALMGQRQGTALRFLEGSEVVHMPVNGVSAVDRSGQLQLHPNPFGQPEFYSWRKNTNEFAALSPPSPGGGIERVEIKRVCKGQAQYRTIRLFDISPVQVCRGFDCTVSRTPREDWTDEARIEATCQDGRKVRFDYGPTSSRNGKEQVTQVQGYFDDWYKQAWKKIPTGVQFVGNRPPVLRSIAEFASLDTVIDRPLRIDLLDRASDPDGDRLTLRLLGMARNGTLAPNRDGSFMYTPRPGWSGTERFGFKVSDGLVEADGKITVAIHVQKRKP